VLSPPANALLAPVAAIDGFRLASLVDANLALARREIRDFCASIAS
jgi:hypothetical protein